MPKRRRRAAESTSTERQAATTQIAADFDCGGVVFSASQLAVVTLLLKAFHGNEAPTAEDVALACKPKGPALSMYAGQVLLVCSASTWQRDPVWSATLLLSESEYKALLADGDRYEFDDDRGSAVALTFRQLITKVERDASAIAQHIGLHGEPDLPSAVLWPHVVVDPSPRVAASCSSSSSFSCASSSSAAGATCPSSS